MTHYDITQKGKKRVGSGKSMGYEFGGRIALGEKGDHAKNQTKRG